MKLKELLNKRVVLNYQTKVGTNDQHGILTHIGPDKVVLNIGKREVYIEKNNINFASSLSGVKLYP